MLKANGPPSSDPDRLELIREDVVSHLNASFERNQQRYNLRAADRRFNLGDQVYIANNKLSSAKEKYAQKLAPKKVRAIIDRKLGETTYHLIGEDGADLGIHSAKDIFTR